MYHDYGASKWVIDSPEVFENFTKEANVTLLWASAEQKLGFSVVGNDPVAQNLVGVDGSSEWNTHIDWVVTRRVLGVPVEWRNETSFKVVLEENKRSAERGSGVALIGATECVKINAPYEDSDDGRYTG